MAQTTFKGKALCDFDGKDYHEWVFKAEAYFDRRELLEYILMIDPRQEGRRSTKQKTWIEQQRLFPDGLAMTDSRGGPVMDRVEQEWDLFEPEEDLQARIANYDKAQKQVWAELVECCKGTPSVMMRNVPKACGTVAWRLLEKSYGKVSTTTTVALLDRLLDYKPSTKIELHCTGWSELTRRLTKVGIDLIPELQSILFLRTLAGRFQAFIDFQKQAEGALGDPLKLIQAAIDYDHGNKGADEANKDSTALWGAPSGGDRGSGYQGRGRGRGRVRGVVGRGGGRGRGGENKIKCYNCGKTGHRAFECKGPCGKCGKKGHRSIECRLKRPRNESTEIGEANEASGGAATSDFKTLYCEQSTALLAKNKEMAEMKQKLADLGYEEYAMMADGEEETAAADSNTEDTNEALVVFKVDSGASSHYVNESVPLVDTKTIAHRVGTADVNASINVRTEGVCKAVVTSGDGKGVPMRLEAKQSPQFSHNLFSVRQAVASGHKAVFAPGGSYIETRGGTRIPFSTTRTGWDLQLDASAGDALDAYKTPQKDKAPTKQQASPGGAVEQRLRRC